MTFRIEYAEKVLKNLTKHVREQTKGDNFWSANINISKNWHFYIDYELYNSGEIITITHKKRELELCIENGVITKAKGIRRFDMLFAALNKELIEKLQNRETFKITRKKLNENYLTKSPYFWEKIEYYLSKKETQEMLYELFGDEKYRIRAKRIEKGINSYIKNTSNFFEETKKESLQ